VQFLDLLLGDLDLLESRGDLVEGQAAELLTVGDEAAKLVELVDRGLIRQQNLVLDRSAPLGPVPPRFAPTLGSVEIKRLGSDSTWTAARNCVFPRPLDTLSRCPTA